MKNKIETLNMRNPKPNGIGYALAMWDSPSKMYQASTKEMGTVSSFLIDSLNTL